MVRLLRGISIAILLLAAGVRNPASAQKLPSGPQVLTFYSDVDDSEQPYGLYLPKNFDEHRKYPLVVMLHGALSNHRLELKRVFGKSNLPGENDLEASRYFPKWDDVDYIVISPFARGTMGYQGIAEKDVWDAIADVKRRFSIDEDRTYLTGLSMGGGGTLWIGLNRPDFWAAIAPVCPAPPFGTVERAPNALHLPVHFFQGGADPVVLPEGTRRWRQRLEDLGTKVEYIEYPGVQHNSWENAYADEAIFKWFAQFKRNRFPDRVRYVTDLYAYSSAYWVTFDRLTPGKFAKIDAEFKAPNRLEITTADLDGFTLNLAGHPKYTRGRPVQITIDGKVLTASGDSISLHKQDAAWSPGKFERAPDAKHPGLEGPMSEAVAKRHVYVYGTADKPSREEIQARRAVAERAAAFGGNTQTGGRLLLNMRAIADTQVRPSDYESSDLVLFGTKETNAAIAKLADKLPLHLSAGAKDYGLLYVFPVNGHYILVNSGTPWFPLTDPLPQQGGGRGGAGGPRPDISLGIDILPTAQRALTKFGDFVLFHGTPANVIVQGRFDDRWQIRPGDLDKMKATGVVNAAASAQAAGGRGLQQRPSGPWMNKSLSPDDRAALVLGQMTLDEKLSLVHGLGWGGLLGGEETHGSNGGAGYIPGIPRLGVPALQMADAAVGVTRGAISGRYSTPLPSAIAAAASWDLDIARQYGSLIGNELRAQGYNMTLGGGVNLTREPRNGRNFEYKGEDPILAGKLVAAEMKALAAEGVIAHTKHYAVNDQENGRNFVNIKLGRRSMRETDLLAYEIGLKDSGIGAVMCSYNLLNGDYACENSWLLNDVLKKEWGFRGFVVSDWGATHSTTKAALAGLDIEMPGHDFFGEPLRKAIETRDVPMARLDDMVTRILRSEFAAGLFDRPVGRQVSDVLKGMQTAQSIAEQSIVLLKNDRGRLPLSPSVRSIAVIGSHADVGVLSGGGSAQVDPPGGNAVHTGERHMFGDIVWQPSSPLKTIRAKAPNAQVEYNNGADPAAAARLAKTADVAVVFVNQPASEGRDVPSLALPDHQDQLVDAVAAANPRTIVVLETGSAVTMPWADRAAAILAAWYPGIRGAEAIANILFGDVNPSAKLPITFPQSEADLPHPQLAEQPPAGPGDLSETFPGYRMNTRKFDLEFTEGLKVGYKWYDAEGKQPLFAFGHGLSYTTFTYSDLKVAPGSSTAVSLTVRNTGKRAGADAVQIYATLPSAAGEPFKRLVGWEKVLLAPGESKTVTVAIDPKFLSIFNVDRNAWQLVPGEYRIQAGGSSRDLPLTASLRLGGI
jgi:beta-glucosidase